MIFRLIKTCQRLTPIYSYSILGGRVGRTLARHADGAGSIPGGSFGDLFLGSLQRVARSLYKRGVVLLSQSLSVRIIAPKNLIHTNDTLLLRQTLSFTDPGKNKAITLLPFMAGTVSPPSSS